MNESTRHIVQIITVICNCKEKKYEIIIKTDLSKIDGRR